MAELGFKGEDAKVFVCEKEREGALEGGRSADWLVADRWSSAWVEGGEGLSCERAGEEASGEGEGVGAGVVDLDGSRDMISKGFVFIWDDGSIVRVGEGGRRGRGRGGGEEERKRERE